MNTRTYFRMGAVSALVFALAPASSSAQTIIEAEAGPFVGGTLFLSAPSGQFSISRQEAAPLILQEGEFRNAVTVGVHAGVRFAERIGLEGTYAWIPTRLSAAQGLEAHGGGVDVHAIRYGVAATYHFAPENRFQPFAGFGFSGETLSFGPHLAWERQSTRSGTVTVGGNFWLSDGLFLRLGAARDVLTGGDFPPRNQILLTAGLTARQRIR